MSVRYIDLDSPEIAELPPLAEAVNEGRNIPLVLVGDSVKAPAVLSFAWIVNEFKGMGVLD